ncbi:DUF998 domain-containing protein [Actinosynnema sp. NPDC047251]|uniref:Uncharacterized protein n=1 Tax=Saccharothrix espanaensis (strain ATCC 51144 / DSM 44229 / JCM 9112 / NBRC 15066 / NRRL 15764) TaxID=1179773 RepID=K0K7G4_SACES|nr:DUF998 domain-containing protein [Saccharothrix espanaensis]CCH33487.1 hypothetical protein BN6_62380 [Saccharothrix espanaensis DSM 44229]
MAEIRGKRRAAVLPLAVAGLVLSLFPIVYLHVASVGELSPISHTISDYIFVANGSGLLAVTALSLAAASVALLAVLVRRGLPRRGPVAILMALWAAGLAVAAVFPTDPTGTPTSVSGAVHRYAGAVMFASLPLAGWLISRQFISSTTVRRFSVASGITSVAFMVSHVTLTYQGAVLLGLFERLLFALLYGLLFALAAAVARREARS